MVKQISIIMGLVILTVCFFGVNLSASDSKSAESLIAEMSDEQVRRLLLEELKAKRIKSAAATAALE